MFAQTIQECGEKEAVERRERRKQAILEQSMKRLVGDNPKNFVDSDANLDADCSFANNAPATNKSSLLHDSCSMQTIELTSEFRQKIDEYDAEKITYVTPKYADFVEKKRLFATGVFGALLGLYPIFMNVSCSFVACVFLLIVAYETFAYKSKKAKYPKHGYIVNAILAAGLDEKMVISLGQLIDVLWEIGIDVLLVIVSFLIFRSSYGLLT